MSNLVLELTDGNFKETIGSADIPVMVDFWASWCGPCKMMGPIVERVAEKYQGKIKMAKINIDDSRTMATELGVMNIPTFIFFKGGKEVSRLSGAVPERELAKRVDEVIGG